MMNKIKYFFVKLFSNDIKRLEAPKEITNNAINQSFGEGIGMYEYLINLMQTCDNYPKYKESIDDLMIESLR